jgi:predicted RecA/RadA family phage recombinase
MVKIQDTVGVIMETATLAEETVLIYSCEKIVVPKSTGVTFSAGAKVYYDSAVDKITSTASGNTLCGRALEDGESADTELEIDLQGNLPA